MDDPKRFVSFRVRPDEFKHIQRQFKASGCISLTEFAKKRLIDTPINLKPLSETEENLRKQVIFYIRRTDEFIKTIDKLIQGTNEIKTLILNIPKDGPTNL